MGALAGTGISFERQEISSAVLITISGFEASGKTHKAFEAVAQGDTLYQFSDLRHNGVIQKFYDHPSGHKIATGNYTTILPSGMGVEKTKSKSAAEIAALMSQELKDEIEALEEVLGRFTADFRAALKAKFRNIIWDSETEFWEMFRTAKFLRRFGRVEKIPRIAYTEVNSEYRQLLKEAKLSGTNLILIQKLKPEFKQDEATGNYIASGFGDARYLADISI